MTHIHIDGSQGEGGGQVLRSSLALSLVTGKAFTIDHIRANRNKPGLMRQHLTAVRAAAKICGKDCDDAKIGSVRLTFHPGKVRGGEYAFNVGTAGSATLVLQTVLPALLLAEEPSTLTLSGGTHNPMAPPLDFLQKAFLPLVNRLGPTVDATLIRYGFYPAGGGEFQVRIQPVKKLSALELTDRGGFVEKRAKILFARLPGHVAERERDTLLAKTDLDEPQIEIDHVRQSAGPGNLVMLETASQNVTELFTGFGELGVSAETVAGRVVDQYRRYLAADVPVGEYLADQIVLPLGIAASQGSGGSVFHTHRLSRHSLTHIDVLKTFLEVDISAEELAKDRVCVTIR